MTDLLETLMIVCFGLSWPISIRKSIVSRTAKGKSLVFECFIWLGYVFGIVRKFMLWSAATGPLGGLFYLSWAFYFLNIGSYGGYAAIRPQLPPGQGGGKVKNNGRGQ